MPDKKTTLSVKVVGDEGGIQMVNFTEVNQYAVIAGSLQIVFAEDCMHIYAPNQWLEVSARPENNS